MVPSPKHHFFLMYPSPQSWIISNTPYFYLHFLFYSSRPINVSEKTNIHLKSDRLLLYMVGCIFFHVDLLNLWGGVSSSSSKHSEPSSSSGPSWTSYYFFGSTFLVFSDRWTTNFFSSSYRHTTVGEWLTSLKITFVLCKTFLAIGC